MTDTDAPAMWLAERLDDANRDAPAERIAREHMARLTAREAGPLLVSCLAELIRLARAERVKREQREAYRRSPEAAYEREYRSAVRRLTRDSERARAELAERDPDEFARRFTIAGAIQAFRDEIRHEVLGSLLEMTFTHPDGHEVRWADATIAEHRAAIASLMPTVGHGLAEIARHEEAIELIERHGVTSLSGLHETPLDTVA